MDRAFTPDPGTTESSNRHRRPAPRPDRFAFWAVLMAVVAMIAGVASADASDGGISTGGDGGGDASATGGNRYDRIWDGYSRRAKRWARRTSECESGGDPDAIGGGGTYRGAFQFMRSTWRNAPKSPGGDPIRYRWRTQAVVAVSLKRRDGTSHWPNCG
jgi:Transglycosylase-like domain